MAECLYSGLLHSCSPQDASCTYGASLMPCVMVVLICIAFSGLPRCKMRYAVPCHCVCTCQCMLHMGEWRMCCLMHAVMTTWSEGHMGEAVLSQHLTAACLKALYEQACSAGLKDMVQGSEWLWHVTRQRFMCM